MTSQPQGMIWVCTDCLLARENGEEPDRGPAFADEPEPWALEPGTEVTLGILDEEHDPECDPDERAHSGCGCDHRDFSWSRCEGCGSTLGGERFAYTYWAEEQG